MNNMIISKYTFIIPNGNVSILYNCRNERLAVIDNALANRLTSNLLPQIKQNHESFYQFLLDNLYIVSEDIDEFENLKAEWEYKDSNDGNYSIFINTTLDCNLRCWYCYEEHQKNSILSKEVYTSVTRLIESKASSTTTKYINLSFFGGEPLMTTKSIIQPLITDTLDICIRNSIHLNVSFVTNGTLLRTDFIDFLKGCPFHNPPSFQITLDGNAYIHNKTKFFPSGKGTYQIIIHNIQRLLATGFFVRLRLNMTDANIDSFVDVISELKELTTKQKSFLQIDLQHIWQDQSASGSEFDTRQLSIRQYFKESGFFVNEMKRIDSSRCYADKSNHVTINYNGDLFKCTARDFRSTNREGVIDSQGDLHWNERKSLRDSIKYGNDACRKCNIYPLCHGGCSQYKLEHQEIVSCIRGYDETYKRKIVEERIDFLLEECNIITKTFNND